MVSEGLPGEEYGSSTCIVLFKENSEDILAILLLLCYCCGGHGTGLEKSGVMLPLLSLITSPFESVLGA